MPSLRLPAVALLLLVPAAGRAAAQSPIREVAGLAPPDSAERRGPPRRPFRPPAGSLASASDVDPFQSSAFPVTATALDSGPNSKSWQVANPAPQGATASCHPHHPRPAARPVLTLRLLGSPDVGLDDRTAALLASGHAVLSLSPQPDSTGRADTKSALLGPWYLPALRPMLIGRTILGRRVQDTLLALDYLDGLRLAHAPALEAEASGHMALVLLHAAVLDAPPEGSSTPPRLRRIAPANLPPTYAQLLANPRPRDAAQDVLPGVLLHYDLPDLLAPLSTRATLVEPDNQAP